MRYITLKCNVHQTNNLFHKLYLYLTDAFVPHMVIISVCLCSYLTLVQ
jgi:hypothetical protein